MRGLGVAPLLHTALLDTNLLAITVDIDVASRNVDTLAQHAALLRGIRTGHAQAWVLLASSVGQANTTVSAGFGGTGVLLASWLVGHRGVTQLIRLAVQVCRFAGIFLAHAVHAILVVVALDSRAGFEALPVGRAAGFTLLAVVVGAGVLLTLSVQAEVCFRRAWLGGVCTNRRLTDPLTG